MKQRTNEKTCIVKVKTVTFAKQVFLILIPTISEYKEHGIWSDLWMTENERNLNFSNLIQEIQDHVLFNNLLSFQENFQQIYKPKTLHSFL